jgi:hypothetical protein
LQGPHQAENNDKSNKAQKQYDGCVIILEATATADEILHPASCLQERLTTED